MAHYPIPNLPPELEGWEALWRQHTLPFLRALSGSEDVEDLPFCFQLVDDPQTGGVRSRHFTEAFPRARVDFIQGQRQGAGVFVTVNETDGKGRSKKNITRIRAIWVDIDAPEGVTWEPGHGTDAPHVGRLKFSDMPVDVPLAPSIVVKTKKGYHLYWLTLPGMPVEMAHDLLWWAHVWCRGDRAVAEVARVLRVPGNFHLKDPTSPRLLELLECDPGKLYSPEELLAAFPPVAGRERPPPQGIMLGDGTILVNEEESQWGVEMALGYLNQRPGAVEGQHGDQHTFQTAARVADFITDEETAVRLLMGWNAKCQPPWTEQDLRAKWAHACRYRQQPVGAAVVLERQVAGLRDLLGDPVQQSAAAVAAQVAPALRPPPPAFPADPSAAPPAPAPVALPGAPGAAGVPLPPVYDPNLNANLSFDSKNQLQASGTNYFAILKLHAGWQGVFRYNLFRRSTDVCSPPPLEPIFQEPAPHLGTVRDTDVINATLWLQRNFLVKAAKPQVADVVYSLSRTQPYHPVVDYLRALRWDGVPRVDTWLQTYCNAVTVDAARPGLATYVRLVSRYWLISAVARALRHVEGCQVDTMLILEGLQGLGKSQLFRALAVRKDWHADAKIDVHDKDTLQNMLGVWVWEMAELDALSRHDAGSLRAFLTQQSNRFRAPFDREPELHHRQTVFCGTSNHTEYLKDETGARRFWPVLCQGEVNLQAIRQDVHQLWAEAVALHDAGEPWWPQPEHADVFAAEQAERYQEDAWHSLVATYLAKEADRQFLTTAHVLDQVLELDKGRWGQNEQKRVGAIFRRLGWTAGRMPENPLVRGWKRPEPAVAQQELIR